MDLAAVFHASGQVVEGEADEREAFACFVGGEGTHTASPVAVAVE